MSPIVTMNKLEENDLLPQTGHIWSHKPSLCFIWEHCEQTLTKLSMYLACLKDIHGMLLPSDCFFVFIFFLITFCLADFHVSCHFK
ncbi:hypothetical protein AB205_0145800 [Aquarana catesbeiana]|uniref:Uncharacterized protein n=1 Tax=Aquarana catesbeiana TaxID=8400 RepID=A0A2G9SD41_AQUCT|nr:hypothetical protein AB205_0145800 [Aquarana catesbeiana]